MTDVPEPNWEAFYQDYRKPGFIPGYEILNKLGGGAFGLVFKARKESIGKDYAAKFLKLDEPGVRMAVMRELDSVSLFAQVDHPNLVTIEDKGEVHGIPFILMGYAGEETLRDRIDSEPLDRETALRLFAQVARGVQALHDHSLVHFDLKPGNVFLRGDIARLGDYGLSKLVSASHNSLSFGRGTPYYMAPELLEQRGDWRSDIYSLGVILFECLAGRVPFQGDSEWEVLRKHERAEPEYPATIPERERRVIARCLQKDPEQRYHQVNDLLADLLLPDPTAPVAPAPRPPRRAAPVRAAAPISATTAAALSAAAELGRRPRRRPVGWLVLLLIAIPFLGAFFLVSSGGSSSRVHSKSSRATRYSARAPRSVQSRSGPRVAQATASPLPVTRIRRGELKHVEATLERLRKRRIDPENAQCELEPHSRVAAIVGANQLIALNYKDREDVQFAARLHRVLGKLTKYQFRIRSVPSRGRIPTGTVNYNRNVATQFRRFVLTKYR